MAVVTDNLDKIKDDDALMTKGVPADELTGN